MEDDKVVDESISSKETRRAVSLLALTIMRRQWFRELDFIVDDHMARLLLSVYHAWISEEPINKKAALGEMNLQDIKTSRKYIVHPENELLIKSVQSEKDRRNELLIPTQRLNDLVGRELSDYMNTLEVGIENVHQHTISHESELTECLEPSGLPEFQEWPNTLVTMNPHEAHVSRRDTQKLSVEVKLHGIIGNEPAWFYEDGSSNVPFMYNFLKRKSSRFSDPRASGARSGQGTH